MPGRKAAIRAAIARLALLSPDRTLRFVELPAGQDPDDVINARRPRSVRGTARQARAARRPAVAARAGSGAADHARSLGGPQAAPDRPCRDHRPRRTSPASTARTGSTASTTQRRPAGAQRARALTRSAGAASRTGASSRPTRRSGTRRAHRRQRHRRADRPRADARVHQFPGGTAGPLRAARSPADHRHRTAEVRDELVNAAFSGAALDREASPPYWATDGATGGKAPRAMGFSFTRRDSDPDRARSDLAAAVEIIAAAEEVERPWSDATERLKRDLTDEAFEEQQRLIAGAARIKREAGAACRHRLSGGTIWRKTKPRKSIRPTRATPR